MAFYRTCIGCRFEKAPCQVRAELSRQVAGLGLTSVTFRCGWKREVYDLGAPVWARLVIEWGGEYEPEPIVATFPGYFMGTARTGQKHIVFVPPGSMDNRDEFAFEPMNGGNGYCKVPRRFVTARQGEVPASRCKWCGQIAHFEGHDELCTFTAAGAKANAELERIAGAL